MNFFFFFCFDRSQKKKPREEKHLQIKNWSSVFVHLPSSFCQCRDIILQGSGLEFAEVPSDSLKNEDKKKIKVVKPFGFGFIGQKTENEIKICKMAFSREQGRRRRKQWRTTDLPIKKKSIQDEQQHL